MLEIKIDSNDLKNPTININGSPITITPETASRIYAEIKSTIAGQMTQYKEAIRQIELSAYKNNVRSDAELDLAIKEIGKYDEIGVKYDDFELRKVAFTACKKINERRGIINSDDFTLRQNIDKLLRKGDAPNISDKAKEIVKYIEVNLNTSNNKYATECVEKIECHRKSVGWYKTSWLDLSAQPIRDCLYLNGYLKYLKELKLREQNVGV